LWEGCFAFQGDVTKQEDLEKLYSDMYKQFGRLDIIFANAGIGEFTLLDEATDEHFDRMFNVNTMGVFFTIQRALPYLTVITDNLNVSGIRPKLIFL
jgi:NAD(P)-dependent dehydrogenase (short-subunit alcohol dehydrogenase family)